MSKYYVTTEWAGYSRGYAVYLVEAENAEQAKEYWSKGEEVGREIIRDDTDYEVDNVELVEEI